MYSTVYNKIHDSSHWLHYYVLSLFLAPCGLCCCDMWSVKQFIFSYLTFSQYFLLLPLRFWACLWVCFSSDCCLSNEWCHRLPRSKKSVTDSGQAHTGCPAEYLTLFVSLSRCCYTHCGYCSTCPSTVFTSTTVTF